MGSVLASRRKPSASRWLPPQRLAGRISWYLLRLNWKERKGGELVSVGKHRLGEVLTRRLYRFCCVGGAFIGSLTLGCSSTNLPGPNVVMEYSQGEEGPSPGALLPPILDRIVKYCDMRSIEEGREFRMLAIYFSGFESSELVDKSNCLPSVWVEFSEAAERNSKKSVLRMSRPGAEVVVVFRGSYRCADKYPWFGHEGLYPCQFTVSAVERVLGETAPPPPED